MTPRTPQRFLSAPLLCITALLLLPAVTSAGDEGVADTAIHHFQIGYERGISLRYFPVRTWGIGLVASSFEHDNIPQPLPFFPNDAVKIDAGSKVTLRYLGYPLSHDGSPVHLLASRVIQRQNACSFEWIKE